MRVAVVSKANRQTGKTALSLMLSNTYPSASGRESVYVTNKPLDEVLNLEKFSSNVVAIEKSINVITSLSATDNISKEDILDYAYRPIESNAMLFDIYSPIISKEEAHTNFMSVVTKLDPRLIIMDLNGSVYDDDVKNLMDECDLVLYLFRPIKDECKDAVEYYTNLTDDEKLKVKLVCSMWDSTGVKKSTIQDFMKIRSSSMLWFPYHPNIQRTMFEGRLCLLNRLMVEGRDNCLELRSPIKDILTYICDTNIKVIKDISQWTI